MLNSKISVGVSSCITNGAGCDKTSCEQNSKKVTLNINELPACFTYIPLCKVAEPQSITPFAELSGVIFCSGCIGSEWTGTECAVTQEIASFIQPNDLLPIIKSHLLLSQEWQETFVTQVYTYNDWQKLNQQQVSIAQLIEFHSRYKYLVMSYQYSAYRQLGRLLGQYQKGDNLAELAQSYSQKLMQVLATPASRKSQVNTLMHLQGYFKQVLSKTQKQQLKQVIKQYSAGEVPLTEPKCLLNNYLALYPNAYLSQQVYLTSFLTETK